MWIPVASRAIDSGRRIVWPIQDNVGRAIFAATLSTGGRALVVLIAYHFRTSYVENTTLTVNHKRAC